ncbi:MAG: hypothetical protein A2W93_11330 [Bacteroidetes bacterium GWF2_43_63]|nr:MAG: hypothetical protein A2W94_14205 [Bacteroidetes bacterium GWE2_42_42]OFY54865.1 MAG: hypothetical protein A2W93_11330 [Bacteroidetes bacterium GWF2_43_63]HCB63231.1 hypothetical protein [Bacteroidales bacterium]HCY21973.1 hypothetical protein [Bacteroidales bacterium]
MKNIFLLLFIVSVLAVACNNKSKNNSDQEQKTDSTTVSLKDSVSDEQLVQDAKMILQHFKNKEYNQLAEYVGPQGVRFSPYAFIDTSKDNVLSAQQIRNAATSKEVLQWGEFDGSGEPIKMTIEKYFADFVYDTDFLKKGEVTVNEFTQRGNTTNNIKEAYPGCAYVDFLINGEKPEYDGIDWKAIRIVFRIVEGKAVMVAVVHDEWTI